MRKRNKIIIAAALLATAALSSCGVIMSQVETPRYTVERTAGDIEIRNYPSLVIAETTVKGDRMGAVNEGFSSLADYIFGANIPNTKIAMTAPVTQQEKGQSIAMTAPVIQQKQGKEWKVRFVMPAEYTLANLPKPKNDAVTLSEQPAKRTVAIRFNGRTSDANIAEHYGLLEAFIEKEKLEVTGPATYAYYNPPWTLPYFRRNEIMFDLK